MAIKIKSDKYIKLSLQESSREYALLRQKVTKAGILDRSYGYYTILFTVTFIGFLVCVFALIGESSPGLVAVVSICFAFFGVQFGGLIHDAGHRGVFKSTRKNDLLGYFCSMFLGFPYSNWKYKHNKHHAHPNDEDEDPDLQIPFVFTEDNNTPATRIAQFIRKYQTYFYYPLGSFAAFSMRFKALGYYKTHIRPGYFLEMGFFLVGFFLWFIAPFLFFPILKAIIFVSVANMLAGFYLMNIFAPNHKGMPQIGRGIRFSFLEQQIITARNIYGHPLTDYVYLGLNYQIEHHLFPSCPRNKLKLITPYVKELCRRRRLVYTEVSILETNKFILKELRSISKL